MTIAIHTVSTPVRRADPDRAGLRQAMRAEWTKLMSLRSTTLTLLVTLAVCVLGTFLSTNGATHHSRSWYQGFDPTNQALAGLAFSSLVIAVLSVLCMTSEYGSGTIRASLAATPRRSVFYGAKVLVFGLLAVVLGFVLCFLSFFLGMAILKSGGAPTATLSSPGVLHALDPVQPVLRPALALRLRSRRHHPPHRRRHHDLLLLHLADRAHPPERAWKPGPLHSRHDLRQLGGRGGPPRQCALEHTGFLLMVVYTLAVVLAGGVLLARRDA